jgi:hypothetical protein
MLARHSIRPSFLPLSERIRDEGGHSLVILDTVKPLVDAWDLFIEGLAGLGQEAVLEGLIKVRGSCVSECTCVCEYVCVCMFGLCVFAI